VPSKQFERHLRGVERKAVRQHLEVNRRTLVAGESDEPHLAVLPGLGQGLDDPAGGEVQLGLVLVDDLVDLPEVEMIRPQPRQRLLELTHRDLPVAAVRANLGHQEDLVAPALQRVAWYSQALSKKVRPASIASWTRAVASCSEGMVPR
jgi:hypothetical protein